MSVWQVGLLMWSVAGFAMVTIMDFALRHDGDDGLLFGRKNTFETVIGLLVALAAFIAWPLFLIWCAVEMARGEPLEETSAPLRRAPEPEPVANWPNPSWMPPQDHEELLCRMIRLRLMKDPRLAGKGPPHRWPRDSVWDTTEAVLAETVLAYLTLRLDGLSPDIICRRLMDRFDGVDDHDAPTGLRSMVRTRLRQTDPDYIDLGPQVLGASTGLAIRYARQRLAERRRSPDFPRAKWLREELSLEEVERDFEGLVFPSEGRLPDWQDRLTEKLREWSLLALRIGDTDRIHRYQAPNGARGLALVREYRPVDYVAAARLVDTPSEPADR